MWNAGQIFEDKVTVSWNIFDAKFILFFVSFSVVSQDYQTELVNEHVILGNDALFKCLIPSFVSDFVVVEAWIDNEAQAFYPSSKYGKLASCLFKQIFPLNFRSLFISSLHYKPTISR